MLELSITNMDDSDDSSSETSEVLLSPSDDEIPVLDNIEEVDLTNEDEFLSDTASLASLVLTGGPPVLKPRPYQREMLEESLKRNIIVAVCAPSAGGR